MIQLVCDLCGKPIYRKAIGGPGFRRFRIQEKTIDLIFNRWGSWEEVECHDKCLEALMDGLDKAKETIDESK